MATKGNFDRQVIAWITVNGAHVPIYSGETKEQAAKRHIDSVTKKNEQEKSAQLKNNEKQKEKLNSSKKPVKKSVTEKKLPKEISPNDVNYINNFKFVKDFNLEDVDDSKLSDSDIGKDFVITEPVLRYSIDSRSDPHSVAVHSAKFIGRSKDYFRSPIFEYKDERGKSKHWVYDKYDKYSGIYKHK